MRLTIANISTRIVQSDMDAAVAAISHQVANDFGPEWSIDAILNTTSVSLAQGAAPIASISDAIIYVGDQSDDPTTGVNNVLGYHSDNHAGIPYGFVYLDVCQAYGENWTCTLSHEVLELLADPTAVLTVTGPAQGGGAGNVYYDLEVCDPTQGDTYTVAGIEVSNFVTKAYFGMAGGQSTQTNFLNLALAPFGVRPKGYLQFEDNGATQQVFGEKVTTAMKNSKMVRSKRRRTFRREANMPRRH